MRARIFLFEEDGITLHTVGQNTTSPTHTGHVEIDAEESVPRLAQEFSDNRGFLIEELGAMLLKEGHFEAAKLLARWRNKEGDHD